MTTKLKKLTEVEPGEKSELNPKGDFVHPDLTQHMPTPEKLAKAKLLQAKMDKLQKQLEKLRKAEEKAMQARHAAHKEKESLQDIDPKIIQVASLIKRDCGDALKSMQSTGRLLYRGIKGDPPDLFTGKPRENRIAKDSRDEIQTAFDKLLSDSGFHALRSNSIFCSGNYSQASGYGSVYAIFPKDGFSFTWSPRFSDLYSDLLSNLSYQGMSSLTHTDEYAEKKNILLNQLAAVRSTLSEASYILDSKFGGSFESFLSNFDLESNPGLQGMAQRIFKNHWLIGQTVRRAENDISNAVVLLREGHTHEDEQRFDIAMTNLIQVMRRFDGIKLLPIFYYHIRFYLANGSTMFVDKNLLDAIKGYNEVRNEPALSPKEIIVDKLQFDNTNFSQALDSRNEICISGEYYAIRCSDDVFENLTKLFGLGSY